MALNEVQINHRYTNPQPDDGVHPFISYTQPSDWNATELLTGSAGNPSEADVLSWAGASSTQAAYRTITAGLNIVVSHTDTTIVIATVTFPLFADGIMTGSPVGGTAKKWKLGNVASVSPTAQNRTIEVEVDGTTYYLTAKTTND